MEAANYRQTIDALQECSGKKKYFPANYRGLIDCIMWLMCQKSDSGDNDNNRCLYECDIYIPSLDLLP